MQGVKGTGLEPESLPFVEVLLLLGAQVLAAERRDHDRDRRDRADRVFAVDQEHHTGPQTADHPAPVRCDTENPAVLIAQLCGGGRCFSSGSSGAGWCVESSSGSPSSVRCLHSLLVGCPMP